jgi:hypothetical protein
MARFTPALAALSLACSSPPETWDWDASDQAVLACEVWSAAAEYWASRGEAIDVTCTAEPRVELSTGQEAWLVETAAEGGERTSRTSCGDLPLDDALAGCGGPRRDAFVTLHGAEWLSQDDAVCKLTWVAAHELGHVLGYQHSDSAQYPVMTPVAPAGCRALK